MLQKAHSSQLQEYYKEGIFPTYTIRRSAQSSSDWQGLFKVHWKMSRAGERHFVTVTQLHWETDESGLLSSLLRLETVGRTRTLHVSDSLWGRGGSDVADVECELAGFCFKILTVHSNLNYTYSFCFSCSFRNANSHSFQTLLRPFMFWNAGFFRS